MPTAKRAPQPRSHPGPTIFVLFGATGDLAKRLVLPRSTAWQRKGCSPRSGGWSATVAATSRTRTSAVTCTVCSPSSARSPPAAWKSFSERVFFAGGGFNTDSPGSLLDVLDKARNSLGAGAQLVHYLAVPPVAFTELTKALGTARAGRGGPVYEKPFGTSQQSFEALDRVVHSVLDEQRCTGSTISWAKRPPRTCMSCASPMSCSPRCGTASTSSRYRSTSREARRHRPGRVLRRDRRGAGHAGHAPVPGGGRGGHGAAREPGADRPAGGAGEGDQLLPAAGPGRGGAGPVRRVPRRAGDQGRLDPGHVRGGAAVDRQRPLARRAVLPAHGQAARGHGAAGQPGLARAGGPWPSSFRRRATCCRSRWRAAARSACR